MEIEQSKLPHIESSAHEKEFATPAWRHAEGFGGWAVTEKIDGCSLGIHVSTGAFRLSSRECMLEEGEDFYRILQLKDMISADGLQTRPAHRNMISVLWCPRT